MTPKQLRKHSYIFGKDLEIIKDYCIKKKLSMRILLNSPDMMQEFYGLK